MYAVIAYDPADPADTLGFLSSIEREGRARYFSTPEAAEMAANHAKEKHTTDIGWMIIDVSNLGIHPSKAEDTGSSESIVS